MEINIHLYQLCLHWHRKLERIIRRRIKDKIETFSSDAHFLASLFSPPVSSHWIAAHTPARTHCLSSRISAFCLRYCCRRCSMSTSPLLLIVAVRASREQQIMTDMSKIIKFHRTGLIWIKSSFCYSSSFIFNLARKMCVYSLYLVVYHAFARSRSSWHQHHRCSSIADARSRCHLPRYCSFCVRTRQALWEWLISIRMEMSLAGVFTLSKNIRSPDRNRAHSSGTIWWCWRWAIIIRSGALIQLWKFEFVVWSFSDVAWCEAWE